MDRICAGHGLLSWAGAGSARVAGVAGSVVRSRQGLGSVSDGRHQAEQLHRELVRVAVIGAELGGDVRDLVQVKDPGDGVACDTRSHEMSVLVKGGLADAGDIATGCVRPVPAVTCAAGS